ncbi:tudor domain-containing 6 isoform X3 [Melanotaenia boesemani]|uniref:tudor domain-containing 6 isoform X3 n=1 Tax=Melanotaenia boesemani TaxID=1250792 RepID=UPI001C04AC6F|nr:tudor domain-containing 6 isoform X3 [Melanotaenia boesemani]
MCSIPGLPTPGSEVPFLITRVNLNPNYGLVELWVDMVNGRKHIYAQMKEEIQSPQRRFNGLEGKVGDLCLVCISDTWHRARIISIQAETYNIYLIDQGQPHITTSEALAWGQSDSFLLPPEIESCILANVLSLQNEWPEKATELLMSLPGKMFKGLVQHVLMPDRIILLDVLCISNHMCKLEVAKKIKLDEFKIIVQRCLLGVKEGVSSVTSCLTQEQNLDAGCKLAKHDQYLYPELLTDTFELVTVTEVIDPQNIFCKLLIFSKAVKLLSEQIHQYYEDISDLDEAQPLSCGDPCAARGLDGRWHRSLLKQNIVTSDCTVEVFHVDEGKAELVNVHNIRPLLGKFLRMPVVTYLCSLNGIKETRDWTADETDSLKSLLLHQTLAAKFAHGNKPQEAYYVTLYADNAACINKIFLDRAGLTESSNPEWDLNVQSDTSSPISAGDKLFLDVHYEINNTDGLPEESTRSQVVNGCTGDASTSSMNDIDVKQGCKVYDPPQCNGHLSTVFSSELQNAYDDDVFAVGKSVSVKVSCIESPQRFWCQTTESGHSLRRLMEDLQIHYASADPHPLIESICAARNPNNDIWYRAKIIASQDSPTVDVRFIDYGQTQKVPLQNLRPIDPVFLQLKAQAFKCSLFSQKNPTPASWSDAALAEFHKFVDLGSSGAGLKCFIKAATSDEDGLLLNVVDLQSASESASKLLAQKCAQSEAQKVSSDAYIHSTHNIEVGGKEKVFVTSSETVGHFYCQLYRNSHVFDKMMKNVARLLDQPQSSDHPLGLNSVCLARYTDNQWYRGQVVQMSPKLKVYFVDYGDTLAVCETDIRALPSDESSIRSVPVQAIPLRLFNVPAELPQEVDRWFANHAVGHNFTISVVAKEEKGKLTVKLFDGSLNVNMLVREKVAKMKLQMTQQKDPQHSNSLERVALTNEDCSIKELVKRTTEQSEVHSSNGMCTTYNASPTATERAMILNGDSKPNQSSFSAEHLSNGVVQTEKLHQAIPPEAKKTHLDASKKNLSPGIRRDSKTAKGGVQMVYASSIAEPHFFWCQFANTEDLQQLSQLAQEAGRPQQDSSFPETLEPGSPCLALFSTDNQWYRAQILQKADRTLHVLFIDYGNESEVDIMNVRPLPQNLLEVPPQAFLCHLNGFNRSKGSWDEKVYDDFYNLLVDKLLRLTVLDVGEHPDIFVPQYAVEMECEGVVVNTMMEKYWKTDDMDASLAESLE